MNPKHIFWGLVIGIAILYSIIFAVFESYLFAAIAIGMGVAWLAADAKIESYLGTLFFLVFLVLAVIAGLHGALTPLTLLGMCANLAAWDLSRFRARLSGEKTQAGRAALEERHVRLLVVITWAGFLLALLPLLLRLELPFIMVCGVVLFTLLALMQSMRSLSQ